jgi:hypothetical protein
MLQGHGYAFPWGVHNGVNYIVPTAFMPPGQVMLDYLPMWVAGTGKLGHGLLFLEEVVLSWSFVLVGYKLLRVLFTDMRIAMLGGWLIALYPPFVMTAASFGVSAAVLLIDAALLLAIAEYFYAVDAGRPARRESVLVGLLSGLLTFFRSEAYEVLVITLIVLVWKYRYQLRGRMQEVTLMSAVALLVVSPWIVRNYVVMDKLVIGSTSGSFNFWRGHNPEATGSSWKPNGEAIWTTDEMNREFDAESPVAKTIEDQYARFHWRKALQWMSDHPREELVLALKKVALLWGIDWYSPKARTPFYIALYAATVALAVVGTLSLRRSAINLVMGGVITTMILWLVIYTIIVMAFFSLPRLQVILIGAYFPLVVLGTKRVLVRLGLWQYQEEIRSTVAPTPISTGVL